MSSTDATDYELARPFALAVDEVTDTLTGGEDGLTGDEASMRLERVGRNELPPPERKPAVVRFLSHFNDTLIYILLASALVKAVLGDWLDFGVIAAVAVINALIGFVQEGQAERALAGIRGMLSSEASVRRDGDWRAVDAAGLVPGDRVRFSPGDRIPADARLVESTQLRVDEAALTGESEPAQKQTDPVDAEAGVGDRTSMVFSGTIVSAGQGEAVVTATGTRTEIGRIQSLVSEAGSLKTPLTRQLDRFGRILAVVILGMAVAMMAIGWLAHDLPFRELIDAAIGFAVAAIPEGLPALVTITLALGVQQMAKRRAITRKLPSVEALGAVTTVCSDKTGTLTRNEMTVRRAVTTTTRYEISGLGYAPEGDVERVGGGTDGDLTALGAVARLCNDADVRRGDDGTWTLVGEPTEGALAVFARKQDADAERPDRLAVLPFSSDLKLMATLHEIDGERVVLVKGAPDRLLDRATAQSGEDGSEPLDRAYWEGHVDELSAEGLRVLAAARRAAHPGNEDIDVDDLEQLEIVGLWGIVDPPRPEAIEAIADCHDAGIRVKMITGDHAGTAVAIAREMRIVDDQHATVLTGAELEDMDDDELAGRVRDVDVYARTSPEHKIRIVRALQSHDEVVAMTGDGVNDAPALKRADIGIAMGVKGTEATREAAEIVLADDNFATIRSAIREGRRIYDNLRKSVVFLLPTNGAQALVVLVAIVFGLTLPLTPVQVLWVNMITAVTLSLALAYEPAEKGIMRRRPRDPNGSIINARELLFVLAVSLLIGGATLGVFAYMTANGEDLAYARTAAVLMLALGQTAYLFNSRFLHRTSITRDVFRGNRVVWIAVGALLVLQLLYTYAPFMAGLFDTAPLRIGTWALTSGAAVALFLAIEGLKAVRRRLDPEDR